MLRFVFAADGSRPGSSPPRSVYLVGKDGVPRTDAIAAEDGQLLTSVSTREAVALVAEYEVGSNGHRSMLALQTALLPTTGEQTYLLPLELARHRIMMLIRKLEEWGLSTLSVHHPAMKLFDESRQRLTEALVAPKDADGGWRKEAIDAACESLRLAIEAGEKLAEEDARVNADRRAMSLGTAITPVRIGVVVQAGHQTDQLKKAISGRFDFITAPMPWAELEPEEGRYSFKATDRWIEWAVRTARMPVISGPVIDFSRAAMPGWLGIWEHDYEQLRDFAFDHVKRVVTRYRRTIGQWTATSGLCQNAAITLTLDQMVDMTRLTVLAIRKLHPKARVVLEVSHPFGERLNETDPGVPPRLFAELAIEAGIRVDGIALKLVMGDGAAGHGVRDLLSIAQVLDEYTVLDRPLHISALGFPSAGQSHTTDGQADWVRRVMSVIRSRPIVRSVSWQGLSDAVHQGHLVAGGLFTPAGEAKPAFQALTAFRTADATSGSVA